ncbi:hypothetical protein ABT56_20745 [Photobacterium aquae]|uniref:Carbamoyltransferase Kae1-like domain-containing protein n=1 Tax=Photobacterium aquae TaxID=1195763 RepID=A0A0J1GU57_9GAMM|nr:hypothetical protein [Photobacterium aquae]KLV03181.1 hypothetical protein ABT56_20745 [Photobacterium aquae]
MKLIRFSFACSRKVPFYAQLCNHYLDYPELQVTIAWHNSCFILEAEGNQSQLEALAASVAKDFLYSIWLTDAKMEEVAERIGSRSALSHLMVQLPFCNHCHPQFSDNQSSLFGQMALECPLCHGEKHVPGEVSLGGLQELAAQLRRCGEAKLIWAGHRYDFRTTPFADGLRAQVLVCNPNRLSAHFAADHHHVLALSSLEKPRVALRAKEDHQTLVHTLYDVRFAWSRALSVLAEVLRQQGMDYLFYHTSDAKMAVAWVNGQWSELAYASQMPLPNPLFGIKEPLHDSATIRGLRADWHKGKVKGKVMFSSHTPDTSGRETHALCALHGGNIESGVLRNSAVVYFSDQSPGQLAVLDHRLNTEVFFMLRPLPKTGEQLLHELETRGRSELVGRFTTEYPDAMAEMAYTLFQGERDNLTTLFAAAACVMGLASSGLSKQQLADRVVAAALAYRGKNAHRIDFAFDESSPVSGLDFYQTLASIMAFRLATNGDDSLVPKLAFGIMDSLADYLATWIEHLDGKHGIEQVVLAGNEMGNECLAQRIAVRVGKNFSLFANRRLMLDGSNLSVGALLLKQRRRR